MTQMSMFDMPSSHGEKIRINDGAYRFIPDFYSRSVADNYLSILLSEITWKQESMLMYGKSIKFPRLTAWYGDNDKPYSFSGITLTPNGWTKALSVIKMDIERLSGKSYNSVLLNRYRDGNDSISWHTDAEPELGKNPVIASVNFGAERIFQLRHIKTGQRLDISLAHGSVLIMEDELQHHWQHQVPKTKKSFSERINLTFRFIN